MVSIYLDEKAINRIRTTFDNLQSLKRIAEDQRELLSHLQPGIIDYRVLQGLDSCYRSFVLMQREFEMVLTHIRRQKYKPKSLV